MAEYVRLLNEHPAYADFRKLRENMLVNNFPLDPISLIKTLLADIVPAVVIADILLLLYLTNAI